MIDENWLNQVALLEGIQWNPNLQEVFRLARLGLWAEQIGVRINELPYDSK